MVVLTCHSSNGRKDKIGGLWSRSVWAKNETLSPNNQSKKRAGGVPQVVETLPSKCEALSSNQKTNKSPSQFTLLVPSSDMWRSRLSTS
jgi:hypothetical protein